MTMRSFFGIVAASTGTGGGGGGGGGGDPPGPGPSGPPSLTGFGCSLSGTGFFVSWSSNDITASIQFELNGVVAAEAAGGIPNGSVTFERAQFGDYPASVRARHFKNGQFSAYSNTVNVTTDPCV